MTILPKIDVQRLAPPTMHMFDFFTKKLRVFDKFQLMFNFNSKVSREVFKQKLNVK